MLRKTILIFSIISLVFGNKTHLETRDLKQKVAEDTGNTFWGSRCSLGKIGIFYQIKQYFSFF